MSAVHLICYIIDLISCISPSFSHPVSMCLCTSCKGGHHVSSALDMLHYRRDNLHISLSSTLYSVNVFVRVGKVAVMSPVHLTLSYLEIYLTSSSFG